MARAADILPRAWCQPLRLWALLIAHSAMCNGQLEKPAESLTTGFVFEGYGRCEGVGGVETRPTRVDTGGSMQLDCCGQSCNKDGAGDTTTGCGGFKQECCSTGCCTWVRRTLLAMLLLDRCARPWRRPLSRHPKSNPHP